MSTVTIQARSRRRMILVGGSTSNAELKPTQTTRTTQTIESSPMATKLLTEELRLETKMASLKKQLIIVKQSLQKEVKKLGEGGKLAANIKVGGVMTPFEAGYKTVATNKSWVDKELAVSVLGEDEAWTQSSINQGNIRNSHGQDTLNKMLLTSKGSKRVFYSGAK